MAKKLISYNGDAEEGDRLPEVVKDEILAYTEFAALPDGIADLDTEVTGAELDTLAADAVRTTDTSTVDMSFVIDEDSFASDSDTKVPTQQSVKAYVDANGGGGGGGGTFTLSPTGTKTSSYTAAAGQWIPVDSSGGGAITITLPVTPPDGSLVGIYVLDADGAITLAAGAGSELNHDGSGTTSLPLYTASSGYTPLSLWRYEVTGNFWHLTSYTTMPLAADIQDSTALGRMVLTGSYADLYEAADILIGGHHSETFGDGVETSFAITHNLGFEDVLVVVREVSSGDYVQTDITITDSDTVTLTFQNAPAEDSLRVTVSAPGGPLFIDGVEAAEGGTAVQFTAQGVAAGDPVALPSATWSSIVGRPASSADTTTADGVTDDRAALAADDDTALAASLPLMLQPGTYKVSSNITIDSPVWPTPGVILKPDSGITVTLAGGVINAPMSQIFDVSAGGAIVLGHVVEVYPEWWGAVGDGVEDDSDAILAAIACVKAMGGGTVMLTASAYLVTDDIYVPGLVNLAGRGGGKDTAGHSIICSGETARVRFGDGTDEESRGGWSGGFNVVADDDGDPSGLLFLNLVVSRAFGSIEVRGGAGDGLVIEQTQNCLFSVVDSIGNAGADYVLDKGAGGNLFLRCELASGGECSLEIKETTGTGPYPEPQHNTWVHCIFETYVGAGETMLKVSAGNGNVFHSPVFSSGEATLSAGHLITVSGASITLRDPKFFGDDAHGAAKVTSGGQVVVDGTTLVKNCTTAWTADGSGIFALRGSVGYASVTTQFNPINGAAVGSSFYTTTAMPELSSFDTSVFAAYAKRFKRSADVGMRMQITSDGTLQYSDGTGTTALAAMDYNATHADIRFTSLRVSKRFARTEAAQTLSTNGAVTIDCLAGSVHHVTLQANATSMSITNAVNGLELTITVIQDGTGSRTYAWPSNCRFAGGSAPSDATANRRTTVTFHYDTGAGGIWFETGRAVAVGA